MDKYSRLDTKILHAISRGYGLLEFPDIHIKDFDSVKIVLKEMDIEDDIDNLISERLKFLEDNGEIIKGTCL